MKPDRNKPGPSHCHGGHGSRGLLIAFAAMRHRFAEQMKVGRWSGDVQGAGEERRSWVSKRRALASYGTTTRRPRKLVFHKGQCSSPQLLIRVDDGAVQRTQELHWCIPPVDLKLQAVNSYVFIW